MKLEYLLIKDLDDFCSDIDQFKSFLLTNRRIKIDEKSIKFSKTSLDYSLIAREIKWKKQNEIVFDLSVNTSDESNVRVLEDFDRLIRRLVSKNGNVFHVYTVWDDVSLYYAKKLYPQLADLESLLRLIIYRFMIKTAGSSWFKDTVPDSLKKGISEIAEKNKLVETPVVDQLLFADFIQLYWFFFYKYPTKQSSRNVIDELKSVVNDKSLRTKVETIIEDYEEKNNWDRYFADIIVVDDFDEKWHQLYKYRNIVAHVKRMSFDDYNSAVSLIDELKSAFEKCLAHIDEVELSDDEVDAIQMIAKDSFGRSQLPNNTETFYSRYPGLNSGMDALAKVASLFGVSSQTQLDLSCIKMIESSRKIQDVIRMIYGDNNSR